MRALVVYESMFGNTRDVAFAIREGLATRMDAEAVEVGGAPPVDGVDLLVVGAPTHAFGLSRPETRASAATQARERLVSRRGGVREWLGALPPARAGVRAAAFDTRVRKPRVPGSAARAARRRLRSLGFSVSLAPAETFWVGGTPGPLLDGEPDRARAWGERLAAAVAVVESVRD